MDLNILVTNQCNAICDHCAPASGPRNRTELSRDEIFSYIRQAAETEPRPGQHLGISGGEPFLNYSRLLEIVEFGAQHGFRVGVTTNAFWAWSVDVAIEKLRPLQSRGLWGLAISRSQFHARFVPVDRIRHCLAAAAELGLGAQIKAIVTRSYPLSRLLNDLDDAIARAGALVQAIPVYPFGRAQEQVPESELYLRPGIPMLPCPGPALTINPAGGAMPCCNPGGEGELLRLGNIRDHSLAELRQRFHRDPVLRIIHEHGPGYFVAAIRERGLGHKLRDEYVGVCHLCGQIAADPELAAVARETAQQEEERRIQAQLDGLLASFSAAYRSLTCHDTDHHPRADDIAVAMVGPPAGPEVVES
jgi:pyruvate-formate lyase-activating enzyme